MTAPADMIRTRDGHIVVSAYLDDHWRVLCEALGRPDLLADERFETTVVRVANREALLASLEETLTTRTSAEWLKALQEVGLIVGVVKTYADIVASPQVQANGSVIELQGEHGDVVRTVKLPFRFGSWEPRHDQPPPSVGQHGAEILRELGYEETAIDDLLEHGSLAIT